MKNFPIYVSGQFVETNTPLTVTNPFDGSVIGTTFKAGEAEFEQAVQGAETVRAEMANLPIYKRYEILRQTADALETDKESLGMLLAAECGKPYKYALAEIERAVQTFLTAAEEAKRLPSEVLKVDWASFNVGKKAMVEYFPVGLVAGIAPFNFPMNLVAHKVAPAIAAGCPLVLKPATATPLSALKLAQILDKTDLPKGALSVMPMDRTAGNKLVTDDRFNLLSFTGSPGVGWKMKADCGKKKIVLELGGNAGAIVTAQTDIAYAVKKSLIGAFANNGQSCIHTQRIYVHEDEFENFKSQFVAGVKLLKLGPPTEKDTDIASMIDQKNADRLKAWIEEDVAAGAQILTGGNLQGSVLEPTVLTNTTSTMKCAHEEAFGPVVTLESYSDFKTVVAAVNNSDFGLQAGLFSDNWKEINYAYKTLEVGGLIINDVPTFRADHQPYGGVKDSGIGREGPKYAILDMMEPRVLMLDDRTEF
jgi:glyceraldehyde-3-phosphate dehydrogenase (NADP+)